MTKKVKILQDFEKEVEEEMKDSVYGPGMVERIALERLLNAHAQELAELREEVERLKGKERCASCYQLPEGMETSGHDHS